ncbi:MAG: hypothetical protein M3Y09_20200 [Actinomycetota bacterium]|nr:hypothetical protein [Actinomycetota bacterium]
MSAGDELAGVVLMILGAVLMLALVRGGWTGKGGVTDLLKAKFLGKPQTN